MEKVIYPKVLHYSAIVHKENENLYWVEFPDVPAALSDGTSLEDVLNNAQLALGLTLEDMEEQNELLPIPSDMFDLEKNLEEFSFATLINFDYLNYKIKNGSKSVKKTLTIPEYLNTLGVEKKINFSQLLQKALRDELCI